MPSYTSVYPPIHNDANVKATTKWNISHWAYFSTDPGKFLNGTWSNEQWLALSGSVTNQRFHIDLGSAKIVRRIYYENSHNSGIETDSGAKNFIFQGSNIGAGTFDDLVYANDEGWTNLTTSQSTLDEHAGVDGADPKYILVTNNVMYRYYAFKFADNWGDANALGARHLNLMTEDGYSSTGRGFSGTMIKNWMFMRDMWNKHNGFWKPKGGILVPG